MRAPAIRALGVLSGAFACGGPEMTSALPRSAGSAPEILTLARPDRPGDRFRRATRECLLALAAVDAMLEDGKASREEIAGERTALLYVTAAAYGASNREFIERRGGGTHFAYTAPAVVPAEVAIEFGVRGAYGILIGGAPATLRAIAQAARLLEAGACDRALVLAIEIFEECADLYVRHRRFYRWPLVETAACLWLERGAGELRLTSTRGGPRGPGGARDSQRFAAGPLVDLRGWRPRAPRGGLELSGYWRGEHVRLSWSRETPEISHTPAAADVKRRLCR